MGFKQGRSRETSCQASAAESISSLHIRLSRILGSHNFTPSIYAFQLEHIIKKWLSVAIRLQNPPEIALDASETNRTLVHSASNQPWHPPQSRHPTKDQPSAVQSCSSSSPASSSLRLRSSSSSARIPAEKANRAPLRLPQPRNDNQFEPKKKTDSSEPVFSISTQHLNTLEGRAVAKTTNYREAFKTTARFTGIAVGWSSRVPGVKRYWLTAFRTLRSITGLTDCTIFRSVGLPLGSTVIETTAVLSNEVVGAKSESDSTATV